LRSWLKPKCGKAQRSDFGSVYGVDDKPAVHRISGETIRVPSEKSDRHFTFLHFAHHLVENFSPGLLCAFALNKSFCNFNIFPLGKFRQLRELASMLITWRSSSSVLLRAYRKYLVFILLVAFGRKARD